MLTRRTVIQGALTALRKKRPNFLFLIADDHAGYVLGADGNKTAMTPNIDRLASEGTRFARNFCNSPVCTPSRQCFFTGQMPHAAGVTVLSTPLSEEKQTLAKQLRKGGYSTAVFGKMHFNRPSRSGMHGFDYLMTENDVTRFWSEEKPALAVPPGIETKKLPWRPFKDPAEIWLNAGRLPYPRMTPEMRSSFLARKAMAYLDERKDAEKPFALWVSFQEPHSPYDFPVEYRDRFPLDRFPVPQVGPEDAWQIPLIFRNLTDRQKQGIAASYYTSASFLDYNLGRVLEHLKRLKLDENTYVVYIADHGYMLGQHGRFEKHCCYEPALRVPLVMRWPGRIRQGVVNDMTESVDVTPTILDMLGAPALAAAQGHSLRPYLEGKTVSSPRDHVFSEYLENEEACIRTDQHKFIFCSGKRVRTDGYETDNPAPGRYIRLYDHQNDPGEFTDIAKGNPELVRRFEGLMLARFRKTHPDAGQEPKGAGTEDLLEWYVRPRDAK